MLQQKVKIDLQKIRDFLSKERNVISAYIFGSAKDGIVKQGSDLDIAVLFDDKPDTEESLIFYSQLCSILPEIDMIDFVILNDADPILAFEAISGKKILDNNPEKNASFVSLISRLYEDTMINLEYQYELRKIISM